MTLKADLADATVTALQDLRCAAVRLLLEDLLERHTYGGGIPQYRVYLKGTDTPVTDFATLLTHITETDILVTYEAVPSTASYRDKSKPILVLLNSLEVRILNGLDEDAYFTQRFGAGVDTIAVSLLYLADADSTLPLKAINATVLSYQPLA